MVRLADLFRRNNLIKGNYQAQPFKEDEYEYR